MKNQLKAIDNGNISPENVREIATKLDVKEEEVVEMNNRLFSSDQSLNQKISEQQDTDWQDQIKDDRETHDITIEKNNLLNTRKALLSKAMLQLNDREKEILNLRKLSEDPKKLEELSKKFKISRERVRQIEEKAIEKLQKLIKTN